MQETPQRPTLFQMALVELGKCHAERCDGYRSNACDAELERAGRRRSVR
jgi:hypothetical protein